MARVASGDGRNDRALSTVVGYALNIAVVTVLLSVLLIAAGGLVEDQRGRVSESELAVIGERLASDLQSADRLAETGASDVTVRSRLPTRVAGQAYEIEIEGSDPQVLVLTSDSTDSSVRVPVPLDNTVSGFPVRGGDVQIELVSGDLEVSPDE